MTPELFGHPVEILALEKGRSMDRPMALVTMRLHPERGRLECVMLMFTKEQCLRLRDTLDDFLCDPDSWLFVPPEQQVVEQ